MKITDLTTYDDIRAALGVAKSELKDNTVSLAVYRNNLQIELDKVGSGLLAAFEGLSDDDSLWTEPERTFANLVQLFSTYAVAKHLTVSLPLFSPKEISDGKSHITRYAVDPYKATVEGIHTLYETYRSALVEAFKALTSSSSTSVVRTFMSVAAAASDPVTGN